MLFGPKPPVGHPSPGDKDRAIETLRKMYPDVDAQTISNIAEQQIERLVRKSQNLHKIHRRERLILWATAAAVIAFYTANFSADRLAG